MKCLRIEAAAADLAGRLKPGCTIVCLQNGIGSMEQARPLLQGLELIPWILLLPDWLFRLVARRMLAIDPLARSSMWDDLRQGRPTEIDYLNQAVGKKPQTKRSHSKSATTGL